MHASVTGNCAAEYHFILPALTAVGSGWWGRHFVLHSLPASHRTVSCFIRTLFSHKVSHYILEIFGKIMLASLTQYYPNKIQEAGTRGFISKTPRSLDGTRPTSMLAGFTHHFSSARWLASNLHGLTPWRKPFPSESYILMSRHIGD